MAQGESFSGRVEGLHAGAAQRGVWLFRRGSPPGEGVIVQGGDLFSVLWRKRWREMAGM